MINFSAIAPEVFQILRSRDFVVDLYDDVGNKVIEPDDARRFYINDENHLVALVDSNDNSTLKVRLSKNADLTRLKSFLETLRMCANKYNMLFDAKKGDRDYQPRDFATMFSVTNEGRIYMQDLTEGMYGTSRSSYLKLENAKMIVRHSERINEEMMGARSRKVESIFIENAQGERMLFPTRQLAPARAMTSHVDQGGSFYDAVGQQFQRMATDYQNLGQCSAFVYSNGGVMAESAGSLREACRTKLREMRRVFERCYRSASGYQAEAAVLAQAGEPALVEATVLESVRSILACEGKEVGEDIIESVARLVGDGSAMLDEAEGSFNRGEDREAAGVVVRFSPAGAAFAIQADVWKDFLAGNVQMIPNASTETGDHPMFARGEEGKTAEMLFKLGNIVPNLDNDRLVAILSHVCDRLPDLMEDPARNAEEIRKMRMLALHTIKSAGQTIDPIVTAPIREFVEWFKATNANFVLSEGYHDYTELEARAEQAGPNSEQKEIAVSDVISNFRVQDFLSSESGQEFDITFDPEADRDFQTKYVKNALSAYLSNRMDEEHGVEDYDMDDVADELFPAVRAKLEMDGFTLTEDDTDDKEALPEPEEDALEETRSINESVQLHEGVGYEGILTTNSKGLWSSQGRGTNDDGVQGFYYTTELSGGARADLFVHDGEKVFDLVVATGDQVSATVSGAFNTAFDLASQVDEEVQQHGMGPIDSNLEVAPNGVPAVAGIETGAMDIAPEPEAALPAFGAEDFSTGSLDADTDWASATAMVAPEPAPIAPPPPAAGDLPPIELDAEIVDEERDIHSFDMDRAPYDGRGDDDDRYNERDAYDIEDEEDEVYDPSMDPFLRDAPLLDSVSEEQELTREDILLPSDKGQDLEAEVASDTDQSEVDRIATLAGVKKTLNGGL